MTREPIQRGEGVWRGLLGSAGWLEFQVCIAKNFVLSPFEVQPSTPLRTQIALHLMAISFFWHVAEGAHI